MDSRFVKNVEDSICQTEECNKLPNEESQNPLISLATSATSLTASKYSKAKESFCNFFRAACDAEDNSSSSKTVSEENAPKNSVREKLSNAWLSFKYGYWRLKKNIDFRENSQLWLLGSFYSNPNDVLLDAGIQEFLLDYYSRIWLTYRTELPCLPGSSKTTDCGWGCMLRSCQMMIAETLVLLHLGRKWRFSKQQAFERNKPGISYIDILSLFSDDVEAQLGLHRLMEIAQKKYEKPVGTWYSPSEALSLFREALEKSDLIVTGGLKLFCVNDGFLLKSEILSASNHFQSPLLLIICIRLGTTKINTCYRSHVLNLLSVMNTVGMIGGRPKHSLYFIGWYDRKYLIYLDPHVVHTAVPNCMQSTYWQTFHCTDILKMQLDDIDPSCAFGFLIKSEHELELLLSDLRNCQLLNTDSAAEGNTVSTNAIISVVSERPALSFCCSNISSDETGGHDFEILHLHSSD